MEKKNYLKQISKFKTQSSNISNLLYFKITFRLGEPVSLQLPIAIVSKKLKIKKKKRKEKKFHNEKVACVFNWKF